ncbi:unnamed protein product [Pedinophyceae sp. YPF-701]|nr:unnamed protein product [Pedinophyceae sp. YPF-701]
MDEKLYAYVLGRTREEPLLRDLRVETHELRGSRMQISPEQGQFMQQIVRMTRARRAIEVGVFTGYSALCTAMALPDGGELVACDNDADTMEIAKKYFEKAGVAAKVRCVVAPALETLAALLGDGQAGTFDLAFIDADKKRYKDYYELCLELVRPGGLVAVDNVLWYGRVADEADTKAPTLAIREFNDFAAADPRVDFTIVPIGDGVAMCLKR